METSKVLNLILAVALVVLSVKITFLDSDKGGGAANGECDTAQIVLDNIMTRTSIRDYTQQKVEKEKIERIHCLFFNVLLQYILILFMGL